MHLYGGISTSCSVHPFADPPFLGGQLLMHVVTGMIQKPSTAKKKARKRQKGSDKSTTQTCLVPSNQAKPGAKSNQEERLTCRCACV